MTAYEFFFFKQKSAYELVSREWSSDVLSSDLDAVVDAHLHNFDHLIASPLEREKKGKIKDAE